jgi:2-keto-4-pentenoate hydratase/2-oxohepta-3-ene-1,7-dioic acid hydratase in catechol pathway/regulator of RNase E activity RraA
MELADLTPSKIVAVHLNYRSRAAQRGRIPSEPSYFLKPPSSLARGGGPVARPAGCEYLNFEGEVAIVIGEPVRHVDLPTARAAIGWITAANDFGVYDLRWADRGSNVMAKGQDGFTPIGPRLVPAGELDLDALVLRTRVNGEVVQEDTTADLVFPLHHLVADLARFMTLERGDVILAGTPANSRPVAPGDVVEVEVEGVGVLRSVVIEGMPLAPGLGAMPQATPEAIAMATGADDVKPGGAPGAAGAGAAGAGAAGAGAAGAGAGAGAAGRARLSPQARAALNVVSTATLTVQLRKRGIANTFLGGLRPTRPDLRLLGYAHTLRYVAMREDVVQADTAELNAQKATIDALSPDDVLVIEARGEPGAGTIGDILALRALRRGAAGIVTDGGVRDTPGFGSLDLPTYHQSSHAAVLGLKHFPLEDDVPITCAGVLVMPGDVMVGDAEGVLVVPFALAEEVARDALEQERREAWALERVDAGESVRGVYPIAADRMAEYEAWAADRAADPEETP